MAIARRPEDRLKAVNNTINHIHKPSKPCTPQAGRASCSWWRTWSWEEFAEERDAGNQFLQYYYYYYYYYCCY
eukprot:7520206-Heterocapsa_arctica.AAC.1